MGNIVYSHFNGTKKSLRRVIKKYEKDKDYDVLKISEFHKVKNHPGRHRIEIKLLDKRDDGINKQNRARARPLSVYGFVG